MKQAALALGILACASAQTPLKKLNVVALDTHGQPVTNLQAKDLQVFEDGKPRPVVYFRFTGGSARQPTVVLMDFLSDRMMSDSVIGRQMTAALRKLETAEDVYLYFLTNRGAVLPIRALPGGSEDPAPDSATWAQDAGPFIDQAVKKFYGLRPIDDFDPEVRLRLTMQALDALGGQMQQVFGRKSLVWVTHGAPLSYINLVTGLPVDATRPLRLLAEKLELSQIVVYPVQQSIEGAGQDVGSYGRQTLDLFVSLTGGRIYPSDSVGSALPQARTDARGNYHIAYEGDASEADGKRHKIRVTCSRKDVRLLTEQEYYALGLQAPPAEFEMWAFDQAAKSPVEAAEIGVKAKPPVGDGRQVQFELQIATNDLLLRQVDGRWVGSASVTFVGYEREEPLQSSKPIPLNINLSAEQYGAAAGQSIAFRQVVPLDAAVRRVRAIIVDRGTGAVGSVTIPLPAGGR
jgi:VWFA-related protein